MRKLLLIALFICFASFASAGPPITQGINTSAMGPISVTTLETSDDVDFILGATDNVTINGSTTPHTDPDALLGISHGTATNLSKTFSTSLINTATTGTITWGQYNEVYSNAVVTGTSQSLYGNYTYVNKSGADTSPDTTTIYGGLFHGENTGATNIGTKDTFGLRAEAVGDTAGTSRTYGLYVTGTGADTNYGLFSGSGSGVFVLDAGEQVYINATSTPQTQTEGALEIDVTTATDGVRAVDIDLSNTKTTGIGTTGMEINVRSSAVVTSGNQSLYGAEIYATKSGADTNADATNVRGVNVQAQNTGSTAVGTRTTMGGYFAGTGDTAGTSTAYGIYATASGADTNYAGYFEGNILSTGSVTGVTVAGGMLATNAEAIAGTATDHITTPAGVAAATAILKNPLAFAQGIDLTASATVGGLFIADDADLGFGTSPFFLEGTVSLADYTPSAVVYIIYKVQDATHRYIFYVTTDGYLSLDLNGTIYKSSATLASVGVTDNYPATFRADITPGTTNTTVDFSVNGIALGTQQTAVNPGSATNTGTLYIMGTSTTRYAGTVYSIHAGNRAFTAAEFLAEYKKGIDYADKWGSQTTIYTSDFSAGEDGWSAAATNGTGAGNIDGIGGYDDVFRFYANATNGQHILRRDSTMTAGNYKHVDISFEYYLPSANTNVKKIIVYSAALSGTAYTYSTTDAWTRCTITYLENGLTGNLYIYQANAAGSLTFAGANNVADDLTYIKNITIRPSGATLALEGEGIQRDGWKDSSTNGLNASYPASGYSFLRPIRTDSAEGLLSVTNVSLAADADTTIYTVPTGKRLVLTKAILVVGADAGTSVISIGADGAETDWLPNNTLSALDAANDAAILQPVPNTTPVLVKSYAGGTVIQAKVSSHAGGATNSLSLFGYLY